MSYHWLEPGMKIKSLHISPASNRKSIERNGLCPSKIKLEQHLEAYRAKGHCTADGKALYTWLDCDKNEKFIKDMIFCHAHITPRNSMENTYEEYIDFRDIFEKNIAPWKDMVFDVYEIVSECPHYNDWVHWQYPTESVYNTMWGIPDKYAHNDKTLIIHKVSQKNIRIVGQAEYYYNRSHNIRIIR